MVREFPSERIRKYANLLELPTIGKRGQEAKISVEIII